MDYGEKVALMASIKKCSAMEVPREGALLTANLLIKILEKLEEISKKLDKLK